MYQFGLHEAEIAKLNKWIKKHNKKCPFTTQKSCGAIGGRLTFSFTPTGVGIITEVECACKEKIDLSDYEEW